MEEAQPRMSHLIAPSRLLKLRCARASPTTVPLTSHTTIDNIQQHREGSPDTSAWTVTKDHPTIFRSNDTSLDPGHALAPPPNFLPFVAIIRKPPGTRHHHHHERPSRHRGRPHDAP